MNCQVLYRMLQVIISLWMRKSSHGGNWTHDPPLIRRVLSPVWATRQLIIMNGSEWTRTTEGQKPANLQSAPFATRDTLPSMLKIVRERIELSLTAHAIVVLPLNCLTLIKHKIVYILTSGVGVEPTYVISNYHMFNDAWLEVKLVTRTNLN